jgi:hypothetical protein
MSDFPINQGLREGALKEAATFTNAAENGFTGAIVQVATAPAFGKRYHI